MCIHIYIYTLIYSKWCPNNFSPSPWCPASPWAAEKSEMNSHPLQNSYLMTCGMEYIFGQFKSIVLILFPSYSLGPLLWTAWLYTTLFSSNYKHYCVLNAFFSLNQKHSIIPGTLKKKNNLIPSETKDPSHHSRASMSNLQPARGLAWLAVLPTEQPQACSNCSATAKPLVRY